MQSQLGMPQGDFQLVCHSMLANRSRHTNVLQEFGERAIFLVGALAALRPRLAASK